MNLVFLIQETPYHDAVIYKAEYFRINHLLLAKTLSVRFQRDCSWLPIKKRCFNVNLATSNRGAICCSHRPQEHLRYSIVSPKIFVLYPVWKKGMEPLEREWPYPSRWRISQNVFAYFRNWIFLASTVLELEMKKSKSSYLVNIDRSNKGVNMSLDCFA